MNTPNDALGGEAGLIGVGVTWWWVSLCLGGWM